MSADKFTAGPWEASGKHIVQGDGGVVAYVTAYAMPTLRQKADARLIAQAPALHAIARKLAALAEGLEHGSSAAEDAAARLAFEAKAVLAKVAA